MKIVAYLILIIFIHFGCQEKAENPSNSHYPADSSLSSIDRVHNLMEQSYQGRHFEIVEMNPFFYFKSGYFLDSSKLHFLHILEKEENFELRLQEVLDDQVLPINTYDSIDLNTMQFEIKFEDYNFDRVKDVFVRTSASNGYVMERGIIFEYKPDPDNSICYTDLILHNEIEEYANFEPLPERRLIKCEKIVESDTSLSGISIVPVLLKWESGRLVPIAEEEQPHE